MCKQYFGYGGRGQSTVHSSWKGTTLKKPVWCWHFPRSGRGMELQERLICGGRCSLWQVWALHGRTSASWVPLSCSHATTRTDIKLRYLCVRVGSGGRVAATLVPVQVHANAWSHHTSLGSREPRRKIHSHPGYNDLVPDQHGGTILPSFSIILIVNKWSVMFLRCTTTFHSDGLVNWLYACDFCICVRSGRHFISCRGRISWRIF